jgi:cell division transport system permease protein
MAILYLAAFVYYLQYSFGLDIVHNQPITLVIVAGIVISAGVLLTAILAFFAVGRYLKMKSDKMYLI